MSHQLELQSELKQIIKDSLSAINFQSPSKIKPDEEEDALIPKQPQQPEHPQDHSSKQEHIPISNNEVIDPLQQLIKNNDVVPLLAVLDKIDLQTEIDGKPLLNRLCTLHLPLGRLLSDRQFAFKADSSHRTALHQAILADDISAVHFCLQNRIENIKDDAGLTPILQAIKLGRRAAFLLCLHYHYYDNEAPHYCAKYNRAWELKVLNRLGHNITTQRDNEYFSPIERAVENYAYDAAEFLTEVSQHVNTQELQSKTDSKGIIRLVTRVQKENSLLHRLITPFLQILVNLYIVLQLTSSPIFQNQATQLASACALIAILYLVIVAISLATSQEHTSEQNPVNLLQLLQAPHFPPLRDLCAYCLVVKEEHKEHCKRCKNCVEKLHFHSFACVNGKNEVFCFLAQLSWFWLLLKLNSIFINSIMVKHLHLNALSSNWFFSNASIIDSLYSNSLFAQLLQYSYIKVFLAYQFFVVFQWLCMLVLSRTHLQINNTEKFKRLYRIGRTQDGSYKSQEIRLMERGLVGGGLKGLGNILLYFFR